MNVTTIVLISLIFFFRFIFPIFRSRNWMNYKTLRELIQSKEKHLIIDVRSRGEYNTGHIPGSRCVPHDKISRSLPKVKKDSKVIVYCRSGHRANIAKKHLETAGFSNVISFGTISRWKGELTR